MPRSQKSKRDTIETIYSRYAVSDELWPDAEHK